MIEQAFRTLDWKYSIDDDSEYNADFGQYDKGSCALSVFIDAVGQQKEMLVARVLLVRIVQKPKWGGALMLATRRAALVPGRSRRSDRTSWTTRTGTG
jgi:hypothetical protein